TDNPRGIANHSHGSLRAPRQNAGRGQISEKTGEAGSAPIRLHAAIPTAASTTPSAPFVRHSSAPCIPNVPAAAPDWPVACPGKTVALVDPSDGHVRTTSRSGPVSLAPVLANVHKRPRFERLKTNRCPV